MGKRLTAMVAEAACLAVLALLAPASYADNGPHGGYGKTTDACAACHRAHTATGTNLLVAASTYDLCITCHGSTGNGANTNVTQGVYMDARNANHAYDGQGTNGAGLLAGGFESTVMNTSLAASQPGAQPATSAHHVDGTTTGTAWGFGPPSQTADPGLAGVALDCTSCHDPHGGAGSNGQPTYRILRSQPVLNAGTTLSTIADVPDIPRAMRPYTIDAFNWVDELTGQVVPGVYMSQPYDGPAFKAALAKWCAQCHTRYLAPSGSWHTSSGDAVFTYRHTSNNSMDVNCFSCHVAHGSSAQMAGYADMEVVSPGVGVTSATDSALLRLDNRGTCQACHGM